METKQELSADSLRHALESFPDAQGVSVRGNNRFLARLLVPRWADTDESERQVEVYTYLFDRFGDETTSERIEFIFTDAPNDDTRDEDAD